MFLSFLILPTLSPLVKIDASVPKGGITTIKSAPEPVNPEPRIPVTPSTSIDAVDGE